MAKSMRSKVKRSFRATKRADPNSVFFKQEVARELRLAKKLGTADIAAAEPTNNDENTMEVDGGDAAANADEQGTLTSFSPSLFSSPMWPQAGFQLEDEGWSESEDDETYALLATDSAAADVEMKAPEKKISTSGPRGSRKEEWKGMKKTKGGNKKTIGFAGSKKKRN
ncbi:hypothetical protein YB2330_000102 [Saitoella coloradoensis]